MGKHDLINMRVFHKVLLDFAIFYVSLEPLIDMDILLVILLFSITQGFRNIFFNF